MRLTPEVIIRKRRAARGRPATPSFPLAMPEGEVDVPADCPSPAEIRQRCLEIQAEWSDAEREKRGAWGVTPWTVPGAERQPPYNGATQPEFRAAIRRCKRSMMTPGDLLNQGIHRMAIKLKEEFDIWRY